MQLRFPGFEDEWNQFKLQDIVEINPKSSNLPNEFYYIDLGVINNGRLSDNIKKIKLSEAPSRAQRLLEINDILFQTVRPYQKNNFLFLINNKDKKYVSSTGYAQLRTKSIVSTFFTYYMLYAESFIKKVLSLSSGSNYPAVNSKDLSKIMIYLPSIIEQKNIGSLLFNVDMKIRVLENLFGIYQKFKKYLLQQIFGRLAKKLQFKNVYSLKVSEIIMSISPKNYQINKNDIKKSGAFPVLDQGKTLISGFCDDETKLFDNVPIILFGDHTTVLKYAAKPFIVGGDGVKLLKPKININLKYLYYNLIFNNINPEGYKRHFSILKNKKISIHNSIEEQEKIANFLSAVDKKIDLIQTQIDEMEKFKKGLLQQMFISRINSLIITIILISLESSHVFRFFF